MAVLVPEAPEFNNSAEQTVFEALRENLPKEYIIYYNYVVKGKEFDFCIIIPEVGIVILEVKGWKANQIVKVKDNSCIIYRNKKNIDMPWTSPYKQAVGYRYDLLNHIKDKFEKNPKVVAAVCYPNIEKWEYDEKRLDIISGYESTVLKEELSSKEKLAEKIRLSMDQLLVEHDVLDNDLLYKVRSLFETEEEILKSMSQKLEGLHGGLKSQTKKERGMANQETKKCYSIFKYVESSLDIDQLTKECDNIIKNWKLGTKYLITSENQEVLNFIKEEVEKSCSYLNLNKEFRIRYSDKERQEDPSLPVFKDEIFNLSFYNIKTGYSTPFEIVDGILEGNYEEILKVIDYESNFNFNQYIIEHANPNENILIRAGAGTGKTYSMISRISFLIYKKNFTSRNIKDVISLITFTREAAQNMKDRLQKYFESYFMLTKNYEAFNMIEAINDMKISTIHSLIKKILQKYSIKLGLGKDVAIVTGNYERNSKLYEELNEYITSRYKSNENVLENFQITMYNLQKRLSQMLDKLENKNMDIANDNLDFGQSSNQDLDELIQVVLSNTQVETTKYFDKQNSVRLSNLIIKLKYLINNFKDELRAEQNKIEYLFVDEFQDTDDVQIELMKSFQGVFGFKFFVVGDVKQCIYRFRGAEEKAFDTLIKGNLQWKDYYLNKNYRSDSKLLEKFHSPFNAWGESKNLDYKESEKLKGVKNYNVDSEEFFKTVDYDSVEFEELFINEIKKQLGELGKTKSIPENHRRIAILVRENRQVEEIRKLCSKHKIYVETDIGGDLYKIRPTIDIYKLVLALQHNKEAKFLYNLYTTSYVSAPLPKMELYKDRGNLLHLYNHFISSNPIPRWDVYINKLRTEPVLKVLREIILDIEPWNIYGKEEQILKERKRRRIYYKKNLDEIFEKMLEVADTDYLTINKVQKFLEIMILTKQSEESRESYTSYEGAESNIVCMTVHKSKGLEFESVIMPYCSSDLSGTKKRGPVDLIVDNNTIGYSLVLDESYTGSKYSRIENNNYEAQKQDELKYRLNEETRILYVAMTRAIKKFTYFKQKDLKIKTTWQKLIEGAKI